jgi:antitoxin HigA-1
MRRFPAPWTVEKTAGGFKVIAAKPMLTRRNPRRRPSHPGAALRDLVLPPLGMSKTRLARALGLSRHQLGRILDEKESITPTVAKKLESVIGGSARAWLDMQTAHDQWGDEK